MRRDDRPEELFAAQSGAASFNSDPIFCKGYSLLIIALKWAANAGGAGTIALQGNVSPAGYASETSQIDSDLWQTIPATTGIYGAWPTIGASADNASVVIKNPMLWHRLAITITGPTGDLDAYYELRT